MGVFKNVIFQPKMILSLCGGWGGVGWLGGVCKVIFMFKPNTVLRLCYVVVEVVTIHYLITGQELG